MCTCGWSQEIAPCNINVRCEACCACVRVCVLCVSVCLGGGGRERRERERQALSVSTSGGSNGISMSRTTRADMSTSLLDILKRFNGSPI
jgi:hypothetical protein